MGKKPAAKAIEDSKKKAAKAETKAETKVEAKTPKKKVQVKEAHTSCKISNCKREYRAKGYCGVHYKKWRQGEYGMARYKTCNSNECRKPMIVNRHGLCEDHFQSIYVKGQKAPAPVKAEKPAEKAEAKAEVA